MSHQPDAEICDNTRHSHEMDTHAPAGFENTVLAGKRPQTHALDGAATGIGCLEYIQRNHLIFIKNVRIKKCLKYLILPQLTGFKTRLHLLNILNFRKLPR
jgi:hypothetical protein